MSRINRNFESSLEKVGRTIGRNHGLEVRLEGSKAYTQGDTIVLPMLEEVGDELKSDLNGFLDNQVAHCKFTDPSQGKKCKGKFHEELFTGFEDVRAEHRMIQMYPGCALNLDAINGKWQGKLISKFDQLPQAVQLVIALRKAFEGDPLSDELLKPIKRVYKAALPFVAEAQDVLNRNYDGSKEMDFKATADIRKATEKITSAILAENKKIEEEKKEEEEKQKQKSKKQKGQKGQKGQKANKSDSCDASGDEEDENESDGSGGSSESDEEGEDEADSNGSGNGDEEGEDEADGSADGDDNGDEIDTQALAFALGEGEGEVDPWDGHETSIGGFVNNQIAKDIENDPEQKVSKGAYYNWNGKEAVQIPYTTKFDTVEDFTGKGDRHEYAKRKLEVMKLINPIRLQLERVLVAQADERFRFDRERGMVDTRSIGRLLTDDDFRRPFKDFTKTETRDVAVELVMDLSGSMSGSKLETSKRAVVAIGEALMALGIKFEVTGFMTGGTSSNEARQMEAKMTDADRKRFNRSPYETLKHFVFKSFESNNLVGIVNAHAGGANADGESIRWAMQRLAQRDERRKILLVFSDGQPASGGNSAIGAGDLLRTVNMIMKSGTEVVGFGIQTECVSQFYKDYVIVNDISKLPTTVMSKVARLLEDSARKSGV